MDGRKRLKDDGMLSGNGNGVWDRNERAIGEREKERIGLAGSDVRRQGRRGVGLGGRNS